RGGLPAVRFPCELLDGLLERRSLRGQLARAFGAVVAPRPALRSASELGRTAREPILLRSQHLQLLLRRGQRLVARAEAILGEPQAALTELPGEVIDLSRERLEVIRRGLQIAVAHRALEIAQRRLRLLLLHRVAIHELTRHARRHASQTLRELGEP